MTQEKKQLLLKDLCMRLQYGVKGKVETTDGNGKEIKDEGVINSVFINEHGAAYICIEGMEYELDDVKPYLRPMSSMTKEERKELAEKGIYIDDDFDICYDAYEDRNISLKYVVFEYVDWLNKKMFDYRGLIPMNLALSAPEVMYEN
jgi:hypothetical protein